MGKKEKLNSDDLTILFSVANYLQALDYSQSFEQLLREAQLEIPYLLFSCSLLFQEQILKVASSPSLLVAYNDTFTHIDLECWIARYLNRLGFTNSSSKLLDEAALELRMNDAQCTEQDFNEFFGYLTVALKKQTKLSEKRNRPPTEEEMDTFTEDAFDELTEKEIKTKEPKLKKRKTSEPHIPNNDQQKSGDESTSFKEMLDAAAQLNASMPLDATSESDSDSSIYSKYIVRSDSEESDFDNLTRPKVLEITNLPNATRKSDVVKFFKDIGKVTIEDFVDKAALVRFKSNELAKKALKLNGKLIHVRKKNGHISQRYVYLSKVNHAEPIFVTGYKTKVRDEIETLLKKIFNSFSTRILRIFFTEDLSCAYLLVKHNNSEAYNKAVDSGYIDWKGVEITIRTPNMKKEFLMAEWNVHEFKEKKKTRKQTKRAWNKKMLRVATKKKIYIIIKSSA